MIELLLPPGVVSVDMQDEDLEAQLLPEEAAQIARAVPSRRREFVTGRSCARQALQRLGVPAGALLSGRNREPLWPQGVVGSITHCAGYRAAAVASIGDFLAVGIDAELHDKLPADVLESVSLAEERGWLATAPAGLHWDRLLFSAKESLYKAWFPLTHRSLEFHDARVSFEPVKGTFQARVRLAASRARDITEFEGRFLVRGGLVLTAVVVPNPAASPAASAAS